MATPPEPRGLRMKLWHRTRTRAINASHDRNPCQLLLLVLLSEAAGGGRTALTLKKVSDAFPKAASEPGGFFVAASLGRPQPKMETAMAPHTDDLRIRSLPPRTPPAELLAQIPCDEQASQTVADARHALAAILHGRDDRLAVVIGPCSIHDPEAAMEYARRLRPLRDSLGDALEIVMRVYFEKPRTTVGWKGLINDPDLDGSFRIDKGLRIARGLLRDINLLGLPAGCEYLDTISPQYVADLVAWGAIGARTTESQI